MTPDRGPQIEGLCHEALARPAEERVAFLAAACPGDRELQREVESLLAQERHVRGFMRTPAAASDTIAKILERGPEWVASDPSGSREWRCEGDPRVGRREPVTRYGVLLAGVAAGVAGCAPAGAGVVAVGFVGAAGAGVAAAGAAIPPTTELPPRCPQTDSVSESTINAAARPAVALVRTVAPARAPNAAWLPPPPKALAMSPPLPC